METLDCIKTRRSKRLFLDREVPQEIINKILECAITAPSSKDCQPWKFVILRNKERKEKITQLKDEDNKQHITTAPISIIVCVDKEKSPTRFIEDGVTATINILLAAHDLGLGSVYVTGHNPSEPETTNKIKEILQLPENLIPITIIPIGYANSSEELPEKSLLDLNRLLVIGTDNLFQRQLLFLLNNSNSPPLLIQQDLHLLYLHLTPS